MLLEKHLITLNLMLGFLIATTQANATNDTQINVTTDQTEMVFSVIPSGKVVYNYYGKKFTHTTPFLSRQYHEQPANGSTSICEIFPAYGGTCAINPALKLTHADGVQTTEMVYDSYQQQVLDDNRTQTIITLKDPLYAVSLDVVYTSYKKENVITQYSTITNHESGQIHVEQIASAYLPIYADDYYLTHFHSNHMAEMQLIEEKLTSGIKDIENKRGLQTTFTSNPAFMLSLERPLQEEAGDVYAGALAWSGNYKITFEIDEHSRLNVVSGMNDFASTYYLEKDESLTTPEMVWTYSNAGSGQASRNLHNWIRQYNMTHGNQLHDIVLNSWEGAYLDFDEKTLTDMMDDAANIGVETFVLDDGWFGNKYPRNTDHQGLGDWQTNRQKLPHGIDYLAQYAVSKGLKFGIWIEPEMVNPKSELAERHPEWIVKSGKRDLIEMRQQLLLDMSNPEVQDFVVKTFDEVVALSDKISYIKWDANRYVANFGSEYLPKDKQSHFWIKYMKGLYSVYDRIRAKYPDIAIQLCSSGGGRLDMGALKYHDEFWTSDNTCAIDRIFIQYSTNLFYPSIATAAHVSAARNHQTGLIIPLKFRFDVAMMGRLGMELQPKQMSDEEKQFAAAAIQTYKVIRPTIQLGDLYRLKNPYEGYGWASQMHVAKDKKQAVLFAFSLKFHTRTHFFQTRLKGLDPNKLYKITELNKQGNGTFHNDGTVYPGDYLMNAGISLSISNPYDSAVILLTEVE